VGALALANHIVLLVLSASALRKMFAVCDNNAQDYGHVLLLRIDQHAIGLSAAATTTRGRAAKVVAGTGFNYTSL
jgi:hypothetical protein